jgi:glucose-1-phosphate cytidylyltransferase
MKVVLFCGGQGLRLKEFADNVPKPMVPIGYRPIVWHLMKYYAHYGHNDFVLCLGHQADVIKNYFLRYDECLSNDFVLTQRDGKSQVQLKGRDLDGWSIRFVETGVSANVGQRLWALRDELKHEEMFLANYADNLSDVYLPKVIDQFRKQSAVASFVSVKPSQSFHFVEVGDDSYVKSITAASHGPHWINGGFFCFRPTVFDYMREGEELVMEPFQRLIEAGQLTSFRHNGFWHAMDTFKEKQSLEDLYARGNAPWQVWKQGNSKPE